MADWKQVRRFALALPETTEGVTYGMTSWSVCEKLFVWERPLRKSDLEALGKSAPTGPILGVRVPHLLAKEARLKAMPKICFTTPHFDGYPAVLVRLSKVSLSDLEELIVEAWLARAPKKLARVYLDSSARKERA